MRYVIELPLRALDAERPALPAPEAAPAARSLDGVRVMCIDDRSDALESLQALLEDTGAAVLPFSTGRDARRGSNASRRALAAPVLCDISLGDEDGHELVRAIRRIEAKREVMLEQRVPAIALTGHARRATACSR